MSGAVLKFYRVTIERVYTEIFQAEHEEQAIDAAFDADDSGETMSHTVEEVTEADADLAGGFTALGPDEEADDECPDCEED